MYVCNESKWFIQERDKEYHINNDDNYGIMSWHACYQLMYVLFQDITCSLQYLQKRPLDIESIRY